ncbi:hypothetical protein [Thermomonas sp. HDW16]|uniref:hypothetical protein n=1 Tax=Thermomonas sp. HDW16 TaxID=2714945 RepID=UPI00140E021C|nr:hypothetical protein [Thermomonas sp. HDW16]QIL19334.1 hypothetical protein G7079_00500 [Thermomonas sp. HDW16]
MTPSPAPPSPAAVAAFLRGLDKRARLFATVQAGDPGRGEHALAAVARVFAAEAGQWPLAQWPQQYWRLLLATPSLRQASMPDASALLPGVARLPPAQRAGVLLHLVAGLDDEAAAASLGLAVPAYQAMIRDSLPRNELGQPDVDVWRAWRAAAQRELERAPAPAPLARPVAESARGDRRLPKAKAEPLPSQDSRWLWLGVLACVLAFSAAFFIHPAGRETISKWFASIKREALPAAAAPKARFDAGDIALHPDRAQLAAPQEAWYAERLALLAWLANASDPAAADAVPLPIASASEQPRVRDAADEAAAIAQRVRQWEALSPRMRGVQRGHWQAWQALEAGERVQLRGIGQRVRQLSGEEQRLLRERFAAQTSDARAGWRLGPRLGRDWPRIAALFGYVDAAERERLLRFLRDAAPEDIDACARLAQSTPPEERAALRAELLAQPATQRGAWLQAQLQ